MIDNWEFLMGLLLPAYGFGYVWLIRTAREDPVMYDEVEKHLKKFLIIFQLALFVTGFLIGVASDLTPQFKKDAWSLFAILILMANVVQQSFGFFSRIAALPPKTERTAPQEERHTEDPIKPIE